MLDLFNSDGSVADVTPEQLAEIPENVRPLVDQVIAAGRELKDANEAVAVADTALSDGLAAWEQQVKSAPKKTHVEAAKEWIASERAKYTD
jgi:hypothetical protein